MFITEKDIAKLSIGSQILGCGGGGDFQEGYETAHKALQMGPVELITMDELIARGEDGIIVTISGVGSPAAEEAYYSSDVYPVIVEELQKKVQKKIIGFISCEIGASSSFEPFIPAALLGVPVIDAPCDGRAHPLGLMGALGLEKKGEAVWQSAAGGRKETLKYVELTVQASVESASNLVRNAAAEAGGAVAVARNPVDQDWLSDAGAKGAYAQAMHLAEVWSQAGSVKERTAALAAALKGEVICQGSVSDFNLKTDNALDRGFFNVKGEKEGCLHFFNEYMTLDIGGERKHTFPDIIITVEAETGRFLPTSAIKNGLNIYVIASSYKNAILGKGLKYRAGYERVQDILGVNMTDYLQDLFLD